MSLGVRNQAALNVLKRNRIKYQVISRSLKSYLNNERGLHSRAQTTNETWYHVYHSYDEIMAKINEFATISELVAVKTIGTTYENRTILAVTIEENNDDNNKDTILIDCGIHAREWLAPATCLYFIKEFLSNSDRRKILNRFAIVIIPLLNPDGYSEFGIAYFDNYKY